MAVVSRGALVGLALQGNSSPFLRLGEWVLSRGYAERYGQGQEGKEVVEGQPLSLRLPDDQSSG